MEEKESKSVRGKEREDGVAEKEGEGEEGRKEGRRKEKGRVLASDKVLRELLGLAGCSVDSCLSHCP